MFSAWLSSHWFWVSLAWGQLLVFYGGYLLYLRWRQRRLEDESSKD